MSTLLKHLSKPTREPQSKPSGKPAHHGVVAVALAACLVVITLSTLSAAIVFASDEVWSERTRAIGKIESLPAGKLDLSALTELIETGEQLFTAKFTKPDGAGRPAATQAIIPTKVRHPSGQSFDRLPGPDAQACVSCHNDPVIGGAGDFVTNVFVSEGFTNANFDTSDPQFSNERGTNHLFGAGLIELLAREMSVDLAALRRQALDEAATSNSPVKIELLTKGVSFGRLIALPDGLIDLKEVAGVDADLVIRPFSQKGVMTSLRQFTVNAMNHHHGMQAEERFGSRWTADSDFDADGVERELSAADISALVAWQATLRPPVQKTPDDAAWQSAAQVGEDYFNDFGCAACHRTSLPLESLSFVDPGPLDVAGTINENQVKESAIYDLALLDWAKKLPRNDQGEIMVPLFGDLKRHKMTDRSVAALGNELLSQRFVGRDIFMTSELWGIGSTAPYGHRNDFTTLDEIIRAHGGDARQSRDAYVDTEESTRSALIAYLKTLVIE